MLGDLDARFSKGGWTIRSDKRLRTFGIALGIVAVWFGVVAVWFLSGTAPHSQALDQQERCAMQAKRTFQEVQAQRAIDPLKRAQTPPGGQPPHREEDFDQYQSHYNIKTGKCFVLVTLVDAEPDSAYTFENVTLIDANERRQYASLGQLHDQLPNDKPTSQLYACQLTPSLREKEVTCKTREEFDAFVAGYLEE